MQKRRSLAIVGMAFTVTVGIGVLVVKEIYGDEIVAFTVGLAGLDDRFEMQEIRMSVAEKALQKVHSQSVITGGRYNKLADKINRMEVQFAIYSGRSNEHVTTEIKKLREDLGKFGDVISQDFSRSQSLYIDLRESLNYLEGIIVGRRFSGQVTGEKNAPWAGDNKSQQPQE